jgi:hypothetical protein
MIITSVVFGLILLGWIYVFWWRDFALKTWPKQTLKLRGWTWTLWKDSRTILIARLYWVGALVLGAYDLAVSTGIDPAYSMSGVLMQYLPEQYRSLAISGFLFITGAGIEWLRRQTTAPLGQKDDDA